MVLNKEQFMQKVREDLIRKKKQERDMNEYINDRSRRCSGKNPFKCGVR